MLSEIKQTIDDNSGSREVVLVVGADNSKQAIKLPAKLDDNEEALKRLKEVVGAENVKLA
jgi:hypothetical protein